MTVASRSYLTNNILRDGPYTRMDAGAPSLLASVVMFCHMCNRPSANVLCVCICKYCTPRMVKVHLQNVYWYTFTRVCEPSIMAFSVWADHCVGKKKLKSQQVVQLRHKE